MSEEATAKLLRVAVEQTKQSAFTDPETADKYDALGILVANYCGWEKTALKKVIYSMLEDSNIHTPLAKLKKDWGD